MKRIVLFLILSLSITDTFAQFKTNSYINKSVDGYIHLYFDQQYFLTEQNCEFKTYTRVCRYDKANGGYDGFFTDYYNNGTTALTGNYLEGKKDGNFKGFYPNGKLKYDIYFNKDTSVGTWTYYYPSGEIWLNLQHLNNTVFIKNFWNIYGVQKVVNGKGKYTFKADILDYNDLGYNSIRFKGRIRKGLPVGVWTTYLGYPNQNEELIGFETFKAGNFISSQYYYPENASVRFSILQLFPLFYATQAEKLIYKNCTIDDNQGYSLYLQEHLNNSLPFVWDLKEAPSKSFKYAVNIDSTGTAKSIIPIDSISAEFSMPLEQALKKVNYWIPSFIHGKTVEDTLIIKFSKAINTYGKAVFDYPIIKRKKERRLT